MARRKPNPRKKTREIPQTEGKKKGDLQALAAHAKENPVVYGVAAAFIVLCALLGLLYRASSMSREKDVAERYLRALDAEDPSLRLASLDPITDERTGLKPQVLYMTGETAFDASEYDEAREAFEQLADLYPDSEFTPDAVEGLGYIAEAEEAFNDALARYDEVLERWPTSFAALRQHLNRGRCFERLGDIQKAVEAYRAQVEAFPGSNAAADAQAALDRLRKTHPDAFSEEAPVAPAGIEPELEIEEATDAPGELEPVIIPTEEAETITESDESDADAQEQPEGE